MDGKQLGNMPAYAHTTTKQIDRGQNGYEYKDIIAGGITLRQHFAGLALQGLRANSHEDCPHNSVAVAELAVADADALLEALARSSS